MRAPMSSQRPNSHTYLCPTGFVHSPFGHDGKVGRLAGGLGWFSAVELIREEGASLAAELLSVAQLEEALGTMPADTRLSWERLTAVRAPLAVWERTIRLDQPPGGGVVHVTPDSLSDGGKHEDPSAAGGGGAGGVPG